MEFYGEIRGGIAIEKLLREFPKRIQRDLINKTVSKGASVLVKQAKANLKANGSVETGTLLKAIRKQKKKKTHGIYQIFTDDTAPHAHLVEFGTGPRKLKKPTPFEIMPGEWITLKQTGSAPAKPFMRPAFDETKQEVLIAMLKHMVKSMAKEVEKMNRKYRTLSKTYRRKLAK